MPPGVAGVYLKVMKNGHLLMLYFDTAEEKTQSIWQGLAPATLLEAH